MPRAVREGFCVTCGRPAFAGEARCGVCATLENQQPIRDRRNAAARRRVLGPPRGEPLHGLQRAESQGVTVRGVRPAFS